MTQAKPYQNSTTWLTLGPGFSDPVKPAQFPKKILRFRNQLAAQELGFDHLSDQQWLQHFAEFKAFDDNLTEPLALRYHGHQFTHYNPDLGDGRGFLFAQFKHPDTGKLLDLGTKGSGQTPYSRRGDGRLTLKGAVREALATSMLEHFGVNTSKTLSFIETGEDLIRNDEPSPTRSAVLVRVNHSHVRFGSFQRLAYLKKPHLTKELFDYCLSNLYPDSSAESVFTDVCEQVARTTSQWMIHGFVHGVLNTDNINITGESFDYGPYRFLPHYDPNFTAAYFDHNGLYAYGKQPSMIMWNLERLQEAWASLNLPDECYKNGFEKFKQVFNDYTLELFANKIGVHPDSDKQAIQNLFYQCLQFLQKSKAPYNRFFFDLYIWHQNLDKPLKDCNPKFYDDSTIEEIEIALGQLNRDPKAKHKFSDDFQDLLIDEIEEIWAAIDTKDDWRPFYNKISHLQ